MLKVTTHSYRKCAKCGATPVQDGISSFHRFPRPGKNNVERMRAWAKFCWPDQEWSEDALKELHKSNNVLCKRHFSSSCFTDNTNKQLGKFSIPTVANEMNKTCLMGQNALNPQDDLPKESKPFKSHKIKPQTETEQNLQTYYPPSPSASDDTHMSSPSKTRKRKGILKDLINSSKQLTSRQCKRYRICRQILKQLRKLRNVLKIKKKCDRIKVLCEDEYVEKLYNMKLSNAFIIFIQNQMQNCKRPLGLRQYSIEQRLMALTLYQKSPACYRLLRRMFALPCQSSLKKLLNAVPLNKGIDENVFSNLKKMARRQFSEDNLCVLSFDEMPLRNHTDFDEKVDMGEKLQYENHQRINQVASSALVFMLTGIKKKWKQPIAYNFLEMSVTARRLSIIIKEILHECWKTGLIVVATVCDLSKVNIRALDILGSSIKEPYFVHEGHEIVAILNPPHLLKCTRNLFLKHDVKITMNRNFDGKAFRGVAKWCHLQEFYDLDKNNPNFVFAPALTDQHLNPTARQKKKFTLAAHIFSHTVTAGFFAKIAGNELPAETQATALLLKNFDHLFDALNADGPTQRGGKMYLKKITKRSQHLTLFRDMKNFISEMSFVGLEAFPQAQLGWIRTINAVERLWVNVQPLGLKALSTRRLNKDPLENCFGCIRNYSGSNYHPATEQFISGLKTAIISNMQYNSSITNCEDDTAILSNNFKKVLSANAKLDSKNCDSAGIDPFILDANDAIQQPIPQPQPESCL